MPLVRIQFSPARVVATIPVLVNGLFRKVRARETTRLAHGSIDSLQKMVKNRLKVVKKGLLKEVHLIWEECLIWVVHLNQNHQEVLNWLPNQSQEMI